MEAKRLVKDFLREFSSENTRIAYEYGINLWIEYAVSGGLDPIRGDRRQLRKGIKDFLWEAGWKRRTAVYRLAALKSFYKWLVRAQGIRMDNPADLLEPEKEVEAYKEIPYPTSELADRLVESISQARDERAIRDLAIVLLLRQTGLRCHELLALQRQDIDPDGGTKSGRLVVRNGKGGKHRYVAFPKVTANFLVKVYCPAYNIRGAMFPYKRRALWDILRRRCAQAGFTPDEIRSCESPHSWRHLWTTEMIAKGIHSSIIVKMGGWSSDAMIQKYLLDKELTDIDFGE